MEFTIRDVGKMLKKSWIIVVALAILGAMAGYFVSEYVIDKKYEATAMMIVSSTNTSAESGAQMTINDYNLNTKLVNSYSVLCKSEKVLTQVEEKLNIDPGKKDLSEMIAVSAKSDTDIINISVTDTSPQFAQEVANTLVDVFQQEVMNIMKMDNVQVIDYRSSCAFQPERHAEYGGCGHSRPDSRPYHRGAAVYPRRYGQGCGQHYGDYGRTGDRQHPEI